ncbi:hypothetical protein [Haloarcula halophila]|uniref:hypothetical protein n=1 Tax=Haloarcula TaxID=2237 RepID=UPI0023E469E2|nr:hypothetical protein [Halomicroarcula sp. DFY41]
MSKSVTPTSKPVGTDALESTTGRTTVATIVTDHQSFMADWGAFRTIAELSEDTIHRLA